MTIAEDPIEKIEMHNKELVALKGLIYLMFTAPNIKALDVAKELLERKIISDKAVVYQCTSSLHKKGYIKQIKIKGCKGNPKIRKANIEPILQTIGTSQYLVPGLFYSKDEYSLSEKEIEELRRILEKIGFLTQYFPKYLILSLSRGTKDIRNLKWKNTLYYFLLFWIEIVSTCRLEKDTPIGKMENSKKLNPNFGRVLRRDVLIKNIVSDAIETEKISKQDLSYLINLTQKGYDDVYTVGSFLQSLYLNALSLTNPDAANFIRTFIDRFEKQNQKRIKNEG